MPQEIWKAVPEFPGYEVSDRGRVRSFRVPKLLRAEIKGRGHASVWLMLSGRPRRRSVHRLVLLAFRGPAPAGHEGCHCNGDLKNNALENLRWDTHRSNMNDKRRHGTQPAGAFHPNAKVSVSDAQKIKALLAEGQTGAQIARLFGVSGTVVSEIRRGKHWTAECLTQRRKGAKNG